MTTSVKYLASTMSGAPVLSGTAGALATLLDACLVDGFGLVTLDSLTITGNVATATRAAGHSQVAGGVVLIAGATVTGGTINGDQRVLSATSTTFTFATTGFADQTATGTITAKVAPLGWTQAFSGTNLRAFRSPNAAGAQHYVRVDDTGTRTARVVAYHSMSDINTGVDPYPTAAQISGGGYWTKSGGANSTAVPWFVVGDDRTFYVMAQSSLLSSASWTGLDCHIAAGAIDSLVPGDAYGSWLQCSATDYPSASTSPTSRNADADFVDNGSTPSVAGSYLARAYTGIGVSNLAGRRPMTAPYVNGVSRSGDINWLAYPNGPDGALYASRVMLVESTKHLRGYLRGLYLLPQQIGNAAFTNGEAVTGVTGLSGRTLRAFNTGVNGAATSGQGAFLLDVTGPW